VLNVERSLLPSKYMQKRNMVCMEHSY